MVFQHLNISKNKQYNTMKIMIPTNYRLSNHVFVRFENYHHLQRFKFYAIFLFAYLSYIFHCLNLLRSHTINIFWLARISLTKDQKQICTKSTMQKSLSCQGHTGCKSEIKKSHTAQIFGINIIFYHVFLIPKLIQNKKVSLFRKCIIDKT